LLKSKNFFTASCAEKGVNVREDGLQNLPNVKAKDFRHSKQMHKMYNPLADKSIIYYCIDDLVVINTTSHNLKIDNGFKFYIKPSGLYIRSTPTYFQTRTKYIQYVTFEPIKITNAIMEDLIIKLKKKHTEAFDVIFIGSFLSSLVYDHVYIPKPIYTIDKGGKKAHIVYGMKFLKFK